MPDVDIDHRAPFGEARAQLVVFGKALAQAVETLGDGLARKSWQGLGAQIDLDAGDHARLGEIGRETGRRPWSFGAAFRHT